MIDLSPCPFCGKKVAVLTEAREPGYCTKYGLHIVVCDASKGGCGASTGYHIRMEHAVEAWNRRTDNDKE